MFGVTVLVAAWWLDAAAKGIPPTIPFVNFNTVMRILMMRRWEWMDRMMIVINDSSHNGIHDGAFK